MTPEEHKAIARRFFEEVWNQQKLEAIDDIFVAPVMLNGQPVAREAFRQLVAARRAAFPDIQVTVEDQVAEGDKVSTRRTWQATHHGPYRGIDATGKRVKWTQISIVRLVDGKIVEDWAVADEAQHTTTTRSVLWMTAFWWAGPSAGAVQHPGPAVLALAFARRAAAHRRALGNRDACRTLGHRLSASAVSLPQGRWRVAKSASSMA